MSVKTPSAVVAFENVPADAADPVVDVYVNGEKVDSGGGGGGITIFEIGSDKKCNASINEIVAAIKEGPVCFKAVSSAGNDIAMSAYTLAFGDPPYPAATFNVIGMDILENDATIPETYQADADALDTKPITFFIPD